LNIHFHKKEKIFKEKQNIRKILNGEKMRYRWAVLSFAIGFAGAQDPSFAHAGALGWGIEAGHMAMMQGEDIFIGNRDSADVAVINLAKQEIVARIQDVPTPHMAMQTPDGRFVYVTTTIKNQVAVIDAKTYKKVMSVDVGLSPEHLNFSPDGRYGFIANHGSQDVSVIDTATHRVVATIPVGKNPENVTFSPDGRVAYVAGSASYDVTVIDVSRLKKVISIPISGGPLAALLKPDGEPTGPGILTVVPGANVAFAANEDTNNVSVVDLVKRQVIRVFDVGPRPHHTTLSPDHRFVYVVNGGDGSVSIIPAKIDMKKRAEAVSTVSISGDLIGIVFSKKGKTAYVVNREKNQIDFIDTASRRWRKSVPVGKHPEVAALSPDGRFLYVANTTEGSVSIIDTQLEKVTKTLEGIGKYPWAIDVMGGNNYCH